MSEFFLDRIGVVLTALAALLGPALGAFIKWASERRRVHEERKKLDAESHSIWVRTARDAVDLYRTRLEDLTRERDDLRVKHQASLQEILALQSQLSDLQQKVSEVAVDVEKVQRVNGNGHDDEEGDA